MEHEAALDIAEDTMRDDASDCTSATPCGCDACVLRRLVHRQRQLIEALTAQVADLKDKLEEERGRNRVLGFQIRTLREGK